MAIAPVIGTVRRMLRGVGQPRLAWKLRKLDFPIRQSDLVLDAGSGAHPNPYADVIVEYDPDGVETNVGQAQANGKMLVWADVQRLPFRDQVFDYSLCFHVLEHVDRPADCLGELQRVSRRGYIETPNEIFDHVRPYHHHQNRVSYDGTQLKVFKKDHWDVERFPDRYGDRRSRQVFNVLSADPANIHVQYLWEGRIDAIVETDVIRDGYPPVPDDEAPVCSESASVDVHAIVARWLRRPSLTRERLLAIMQCPVCRSGSMTAAAGGAACTGCGQVFKDVKGFLDCRV